ncbi:hypothetical protein DFH09DRAFT_77328 [Mycena vulgaris]|nr:hypothetical protein DFH09DRAFT_77328 [Mycena vulgaris]
MSFPTEVWRMSWDHASAGDLKTLSSSCRLFREICQPLLFRNLATFVGPLPGEIEIFHPDGDCKKVIKRMKRTHSRLLSIGSSTHIAAMVHSWTFHSSPLPVIIDNSHPSREQLGEVSSALISLFTSTIGVYTNLYKLLIGGIEFTPKFCHTLASLPKLSTMHVSQCDINWPASSDRLALEVFSFSHLSLEWSDDMVERYNLLSPSKLAHLTLVEPIPCRAFLSVFAASGPLPRLVSLSLSITPEGQDSFYSFLECCPELQSLDLHAPVIFAAIPLPETSIPVLTSFCGQIELVGNFAAGRPVRAVKLDYFPDDPEHDIFEPGPVNKAIVQEALMQLSQSSVTVEDLSLPLLSMDSSLFGFISELFPKLKRLVFFLQNPRVPQSEDDESDDNGELEDVDGAGDAADGGIVDVQQEVENGNLILVEGLVEGGNHFNLLRQLLSMSAQDMQERRAAAQDGEEHEEHHCEDCDDGSKSECSDTSVSVDFPEEAAVSGEDLKLDSFEDFMSSLANGSTPLPRHIRRLGIGQIPNNVNETYMSDPEISSAVEKLGARYPLLHKATIGCLPRSWRKRSGVWKHPKPRPPHPTFHPLLNLAGLGDPLGDPGDPFEED